MPDRRIRHDPNTASALRRGSRDLARRHEPRPAGVRLAEGCGSPGFVETSEFDTRPIDALRPAERPEWARYVAGAAALLREGGYDPPGADLFIDSDLPIGAGLSSSASLELGVLVALLGLTGITVDRTELARLGQRVENEIIGLRSGIMDQLAIACGAAGPRCSSTAAPWPPTRCRCPPASASSCR